MIEETARVVAVDPEGIWIEARRNSACGRCAARSGCGHGLLDRYVGARSVHLRLAPEDAPEGLLVDDLVRVGIEERALLRASLRVYALPLAGFLAGAMAGASWPGGDLAAGLGALAGLVAGVLVARTSTDAGAIEAPRILGRIASAASDAAARPVTVL